MLGLPEKTEIRKKLDKTAVYRMFDLSSKEIEAFDADISRMYFVNEVSRFTTNLPEGDSVKIFHVVQVLLKRKNYDIKVITKLFKLINNNIILVLTHEGESRLAVFHNKIICNDWMNSDSQRIELRGLNMDTVWSNIVTQIGNIEVVEGLNLDELLFRDEKRKKIHKEILKLEKAAVSERQPKKKFEIVQEIKKLKEILGV